MTDTYPYNTDPDRHRLAWVFFNVPTSPAMDLDAAEALAQHVFDNLGCTAPGTAHDPLVKYDALGGSGAPWEPGRWIKADEDRAPVQATAPVVDVTAMDAAERAAYLAEVQAAVSAAEDADLAASRSQPDAKAGEG
ncbi:phage gene 29 protein family protein [Corynebacterium lipophiloflavum]|uniref:Uncharacterized protein n=1 Tax=Corynebacterium lipophiloflavum (strain ATCC 700352 / DSM 44291 / CCUG 37336 / JCM 10383 / DMMZ 1944) TaxID=525263 RepID=C0XU21_CORLD|nr:hypothetical protein [Corynebacterium lipophiloflavum]EEI16247.1 hypothetical protein HMPREF0298_1941 [Corynebacterium lipophiloflavum DSM 44291]